MTLNRIGTKSGLAVVVLSGAACALSAYLTFVDSTDLAGCSPDDPAGCGAVLATKWSHWMGLPVSGAGMATYGLAVLSAISVLAAPSGAGWSVLFFSLTLGAGAGVWFTGLQFLRVEGMCPYCLATHAFGAAAWLLTISDALRQGIGMPNRIWFLGTLPASIAISILIGGQVQDRYEIRVELVDKWDMDEATVARVDSFEHQMEWPRSGTPADSPTPAATAEPRATMREIELVNGRLSMQLGEYPIIGDPNAPNIIGVISDYTCPACRRLHADLAEAMVRFDNQFAVVLFPMALDSKCNERMSQTTYGHRNACLLSKMGLALWNTDPDAFARFDHDVYEPNIPPDRAEAVALADSLVGSDRLDQAMSNPLFDKMLYFSINLFYSPIVEERVLPTILTANGVHAGLPDSIEALDQLLRDSFDDGEEQPAPAGTPEEPAERPIGPPFID